jgi:hypothetical protein
MPTDVNYVIIENASVKNWFGMRDQISLGHDFASASSHSNGLHG